jgi:hypothetical protein
MSDQQAFKELRKEINDEIIDASDSRTCRLIKNFLRKFDGTKHKLSVSYSAEKLNLKLLRDTRLPKLNFEIPKFISTAEVIVKYVDYISKPQTFDFNVGDFNTQNCDGIDLTLYNYAFGLVKSLSITTGSFETITTTFDGTCLKIHSLQPFATKGFEYGPACESSIIIPVWIRTISVTCEYIDPLI